MKLFAQLLFVCSSLFFGYVPSAYSQDGTYKAVEILTHRVIEKYQPSVIAKSFTVKAGKFVYPTNVYALTHFNSLHDFSAHVINDASYWNSYEYRLQACAPYLETAHIGFGKFLRTGLGYTHGYVVLGKPTSYAALEALQANSGISFQGGSVIELESSTGTPVAILLRLNTQDGTIEGTIGQFYVESTPKTLYGNFEAKIYSVTVDGTKNIEGKLLLNLYGEESLVLAGGYTIGETDAGLVYLECIN